MVWVGPHTRKGVARLVMDAFSEHSSSPIHHVDGNPLNNSIGNLAYVETGTHGFLHAKRKLSQEDIREIRRSALPVTQLATRFGVHPGHLSRVRSGRRPRRGSPMALTLDQD